MAEQSLYRRHRPQSFAQVVGQEHVVRTLSNAVTRDRVHHAYLFVGSRGTGKTSLAKILARSLNCVDGPTLEPCGVCDSCRTIAAGTSLDVVEMDAASNRSVDDIRELRERVGYAPTAGRWKVYILDEAHMLTREAWNAFLKTLEEPPPNTTFVLATTEAHKVMPTIVDRCQRFDFQRPSLEQLAEVVGRVSDQEEIAIEPEAVAAIARSASGSFRDALGTLDQLVAYGGKTVSSEDVLAVLGIADGELILDVADAIAAGDGRGALEASERLSASGRDVSQFGRDLLAHLRQLLVIRTIGSAGDSFSVAGTDPERLARQAGEFSDLGLARAIDAIAAALAAVREGDEPRMTVEIAILRAARPQLDPSREALADRLERLESQLGDGGARASSTAAAPEPSPPPDDRPSPAASEPTKPTVQAADVTPVAAEPDSPVAVAEPEPEPVAPPAPPTNDVAEPQPEAAPSPVAVEDPTEAPAVEPQGDAIPDEPSAADEPAVIEPEPAAEPARDPEPTVAADPEPTAAAEPEIATPDAPAPDLTLESVREAWTAILERVREDAGSVLWHALAKARPIALDTDARRMEIGFLESEAFSRRRAESEPSRTQLATAIEAECGMRLKLLFVTAATEDIEPPAATTLSSDELIERIKSEFDAEELYHAPEPDSEGNEARGARGD